MDVLRQKYIDMQEGQDSLMTALDRWNLSQTNRIKLNIDNRLLVSLEHCSDRDTWLLQEISLLESKGQGEEAQDEGRVIPFDPFESFEAMERTWAWVHSPAAPGITASMAVIVYLEMMNAICCSRGQTRITGKTQV